MKFPLYSLFTFISTSSPPLFLLFIEFLFTFSNLKISMLFEFHFSLVLLSLCINSNYLFNLLLCMYAHMCGGVQVCACTGMCRCLCTHREERATLSIILQGSPDFLFEFLTSLEVANWLDWLASVLREGPTCLCLLSAC